MSSQKNNITLTNEQKKILKLEKKYFNIIEKIIHRKEFKKNLKNMEKDLNNIYNFLANVWNDKNKLKIPAERLFRYHLYHRFNGIKGFYPSPVSCDIAIETRDAILNVDVKTIDINGNSGDIYTIQFEHNQTSFKNKNVQAYPPFNGFKVPSNLPEIDINSGKPILSYLIKVIYEDDGSEFKLSRNGTHPNIIITCLPNGKLSNLFENDLLTNNKTYNYYSHKDGNYYSVKEISSKIEYNAQATDENKINFIRSRCSIPDSWVPITLVSRLAFYDPEKDVVWTTVDKVSKGTITLEAVKSPNTGRFNEEYLTNRFDENGRPWCGNKKYFDILEQNSKTNF